MNGEVQQDNEVAVVGPCRGRYEHTWYARRFLGGVDCGRCGLYSPDFHMVDGVPVVHTRNSAAGGQA